MLLIQIKHHDLAKQRPMKANSKTSKLLIIHSCSNKSFQYPHMFSIFNQPCNCMFCKTKKHCTLSNHLLQALSVYIKTLLVYIKSSYINVVDIGATQPDLCWHTNHTCKNSV